VLSASATWQISSPVEGLTVANVLPDSLSTQRLSIKSFNSGTATLNSVDKYTAEAIEDNSFRKIERQTGYATIASPSS
jgi:hypothetical protein